MSGSTLGPGGEFDRIRRILADLGPRAAGVGDDCAILPAAPGEVVLSTDLSIEGVHFRTDWLDFAEIGWRATAAALSDLAAAAATPVGVLASVAAPRSAPEAALQEVMRGVGGAAESVGAVVLGGDLSAGPAWLVGLTVVGRAVAPMTRRGAQPGDGVWLTGHPGLSRAALVRWQRGGTPPAAARAAFARPVPRVGIGRGLAAAGARAMLDVSDGLAGDAGHLAAASQVGLDLQLETLPLADEVRAVAEEVAEGPEAFAAAGGEDYELLAAMPAAFGPAEAAALAAEHGTPLTCIGRVIEGRGVALRLHGRNIAVQGYDHFG